jgi:hypothetical protein
VPVAGEHDRCSSSPLLEMDPAAHPQDGHLAGSGPGANTDLVFRGWGSPTKNLESLGKFLMIAPTSAGSIGGRSLASWGRGGSSSLKRGMLPIESPRECRRPLLDIHEDRLGEASSLA